MESNVNPDGSEANIGGEGIEEYEHKGFFLRIGTRIEIVYRILRAISRLTDYPMIMVTDTNLSSRVMDSRHVSMIHFQLDKMAFETYSVFGSPFNFTFNLFDMLRILSRSIKKAKRVELILDNAVKNKLTLVFEGNNRAEYTIECEESAGNQLDLPKIDFRASLRVSSQVLKDMFEDLKVVSEEITVTALDDCFSFSATGNGSNVICRLERSSPQVYKMVSDGAVTSKFNLSYILDFIDSLRPKVIDFDIGENSPLRITESFNSGSYDLGYISFYLAPLT